MPKQIPSPYKDLKKKTLRDAASGKCYARLCQLLELQDDASIEEVFFQTKGTELNETLVKNGYKQLALRVHPDRLKETDATALFNLVTKLTEQLLERVSNCDPTTITNDINGLLSQLLGTRVKDNTPFNPNASDDEKIKWVENKLRPFGIFKKESDLLLNLYLVNYEPYQQNSFQGEIQISLTKQRRDLIERAMEASFVITKEDDYTTYKRRQALDSNKISKPEFEYALKLLKDYALLNKLFKEQREDIEEFNFIGRLLSIDLGNFMIKMPELNTVRKYHFLRVLFCLLLLPIQILSFPFIERWLVHPKTETFLQHQRFHRIIDGMKEKSVVSLQEILISSRPFYKKGTFWGRVAFAVSLAVAGFFLSLKGYSILTFIGFKLNLNVIMLATMDATVAFFLGGLFLAAGIGCVNKLFVKQEKPELDSKINVTASVNKSNQLQLMITALLPNKGKDEDEVEQSIKGNLLP